nr:integrase, catalytic region, zinc finger, CCHC-type, peptidase aspartic, catalytic [Tanacetum cinerariifolium]
MRAAFDVSTDGREEDFFPRMKCSGGRVKSIPDVVEDWNKALSEKIRDSSRMVTSVSILEEPNKVANALSQMQCELHSSGIFFLQHGELFLLAVGTSSGSGKSSLAVGMPCTFYSQHPSGYKWVPKTKMQLVPKAKNENVQKRIVQLILFIVNSRCTKHMTGNLKLLCNFVEKFLGTVRFGNDQFAQFLVMEKMMKMHQTDSGTDSKPLEQEMKECKTILAKTSKTLGESNSVRDSFLFALQNKQAEFEKYKAFNDCTVDYDKLERKLNETLGELAQKDIEIKEGLKD